MKTAFRWRGELAPKVVCCTALSGRPRLVWMLVSRVVGNPNDTGEIWQHHSGDLRYFARYDRRLTMI